MPEVEAFVMRMGSDELGLDPMGLNESDGFLQLKPREEWRVRDKGWLVEQIRQVMQRFPGIEPSFTQPIEMRTSEMLTGARGDLAIKLFGPDLGELSRIAGQIQGRLEKIEGTTEAMTVANDQVDYLQFDIDRVAAGRLGMPVSELQDMMRAGVEGVRAGVVAEGNRRIPILIKAAGGRELSPQVYADQLYRSPGGQLVRASDVARVERIEGPVKLEHENGSRFALVQAFVSGRDLVGYVEEAKADIAANVPLPPGYRLVWGGQFENQQRASARLMVVLPISILMIFAILYFTLGSLRGSLLILTNIPFAMVGGMIALAISGEYLSVPASVGFIALLGIAVLNGLVMVSYFRQLREEGMPLAEAVRRGAERRLRPVLMTASIAAFGLVPLLFATGPGSEIQKPLAIVVIGGLVSATLLTLVLLPILYQRFGETQGGTRRWRPDPSRGGRLMKRLRLFALPLALLAAPLAAEDALPDEASVATALDNHPSVTAARARADAARAEARALAKGPHEVLFSGSYVNRNVRSEGAYDEFDTQLTRAVRLPGKARLDRAIGRYGVEAADNMAEDAKHQAALKLAEGWWDWVGAGAQAAIDAQAVDNYRRALAAVQRRIELHDAALLEADQAAAALAAAEVLAAQSSGRAQVARSRLAAQFPSLALPQEAPVIPGPEMPEERSRVLSRSGARQQPRDRRCRGNSPTARGDGRTRPQGPHRRPHIRCAAVFRAGRGRARRWHSVLDSARRRAARRAGRPGRERGHRGPRGGYPRPLRHAGNRRRRRRRGPLPPCGLATRPCRARIPRWPPSPGCAAATISAKSICPTSSSASGWCTMPSAKRPSPGQKHTARLPSYGSTATSCGSQTRS